jgi:hypothetical protein
MEACTFCDSRKGKRFCPALDGPICSICCGRHRLSEIDCEPDCPWLVGTRPRNPSPFHRSPDLLAGLGVPPSDRWGEDDVESERELAEVLTAYDPSTAPDPEDWLRLDEAQQLAVISAFHRHEAPDLGTQNLRLHATFHAIVERQIAAGEPQETAQTLKRLMNEGLTRHEAIHAVGSVVAGIVWEALNDKKEADNAEMARRIDRLTAEEWLESAEDVD